MAAAMRAELVSCRVDREEDVPCERVRRQKDVAYGSIKRLALAIAAT